MAAASKVASISNLLDIDAVRLQSCLDQSLYLAFQRYKAAVPLHLGLALGLHVCRPSISHAIYSAEILQMAWSECSLCAFCVLNSLAMRLI